MSAWRYAQNNQICGPVETSALQSLFARGALPPETLVWKEGMANWTAASAVPEFAAAMPPAGSPGIPPLPPGSVPPTIAAQPFSAADPNLADIESNKVFALLAYIGILFLVPLLAAPQSRFARFHTNQGIVLFISNLIAGFSSFFLIFATFGMGFFFPFIVAIGSFVLMVLGIVNAASGQYKPLPLIGHFQLLK